MICFPNAKINLGLSVVERRPDGYHNLETVFYPVAGLEDALEIHPASDLQTDCALHLYGNAVEGSIDDNLVVKAYRLLKAHHHLPPLHIYLYKRIPSGAGLGGGSADASFMLRLLNQRFELALSLEELEHYASQLGADCPFFIRNTPTFAEGTGNLFSPIELSLKGYGIVVIKPDVFVSTREAFAHICPHRPLQSIREVLAQPVQTWRTALVNDFERSVFRQHPEIAIVKQRLYDSGAVYASMSGSGSAVFGLYLPGVPLPEFQDSFVGVLT